VDATTDPIRAAVERFLDERRPLQHDQFETRYRRLQDITDWFDLDRLPPDADPW
jgi:hypothetical protein